MTIKNPRYSPPYRVYWCWDITYECNYNCSYCIVDVSRKTTYVEVDKWEKIWDEIYKKYGSTHIRFSGGEPFVYPDFMKLLKILGEKHTLNITTNLSFDADELIREIGPIAEKSQLVISASYHPEYRELEEFITKVKKLKSNKIYTSVSVVAHPSVLFKLSEIKNKMEKNDIQFLVIPLQGQFGDKKYPEDYTNDEKNFLEKFSVIVSNTESKDMAEFKLKEKNKNLGEKRLCRMGQNFGMIRPNGDVYRCCTFEKSAYLGNIIEGTFELYDTPEWCKITPCNCYKAMLVGEEKKYIERWNWHKHKEGSYFVSTINEEEIRKELKQINEVYGKYLEIGEVNLVKKIAKDIITRYPHHHFPYCFLAEIYIRTKEFYKAEYVLKKALEVAPNEPGVYESFGHLYTEINELDKALEYFNIALSKYSLDNTDIGMTYYYLGKLYMKVGNIDKSVENLKKASELKPNVKAIQETYKDLTE